MGLNLLAAGPQGSGYGLAWRVVVLVCVAVGCVGAGSGSAGAAPARTSPSQAVERALAEAGASRKELEEALRRVPAAQREGMTFLIENMPAPDLRALSADYLLENVALAYRALAEAPWKARIPKALFLNDILPYASLNETRDRSRGLLRDQSLPLITGCRTPAEAAHRLNQKLFPLLKVRYSTERKRPDQSPLETLESGKATCSGLSILLVDACRAVGVPARVVGTPLWTNLRGNHTWVEVWDGDWHFLGAAEPDPQGLDRGWFVGDAARARKDDPRHAIYASSFRKTGLSFPLVWARGLRWVSAVNVTDRYTARATTAQASGPRLLFRVQGRDGKRIAARVTLKDAESGAVVFTGTSKDESADLNDMLAFQAPRTVPPRRYDLLVEHDGRTVRRLVTAGPAAESVVRISL